METTMGKYSDPVLSIYNPCYHTTGACTVYDIKWHILLSRRFVYTMVVLEYSVKWCDIKWDPLLTVTV